MKGTLTAEQVRAYRINHARDAILRAERHASLRPQAESSAYIRSLAAAANALIDELNRPQAPQTETKRNDIGIDTGTSSARRNGPQDGEATARKGRKAPA